MAPTRIYVKPVLDLLAAGVPIRGMAHITGGGIVGNLTRCFPKSCAAAVDTGSWKRPVIFDWLQEQGGVAQDEMWRVFNCGVGFAMVIPRRKAELAMALLKRRRMGAWMIGEVIRGAQDVHFA